MKQKILVIGAAGQVGRALAKYLGKKAIYLSRNELDLSNINAIAVTLAGYEFDVIINAAAYTAVDKAETEIELAYTINAVVPEILASYCVKHHKILMHYSTDYVFDGTKNIPWTEEDNTQPLSIYGKSKLLGEQNITKFHGNYLIFRTSWVYDEQGKNFLNTMLHHGGQKETLKIVADQYGAPTYASDLAVASLHALENALIPYPRFNLYEENKATRRPKFDKVELNMGYDISLPSFPSGIYHLVNAGSTNWYEFAQEIFQLARSNNVKLALKELVAIDTLSYPTPAKRPLYSVLDCEKIHSILNISMPSWQDGLNRCFLNKY